MAEKSMQKSKIKVVDNFLPIFEFAPMKSEIEGANFPWYWQENSHANYFDGEWKADSVPQLCHGFIEDRKDISDWYNIFRFSTIFKKLDVEIIDKFKVNCNYKTSENNIGWFHTDFTDEQWECIRVCVANAPIPYDITKKKIPADILAKIGQPTRIKEEGIPKVKYDLTKYGIQPDE